MKEEFKTADLSLTAYLSYLGYDFEAEVEETKRGEIVERQVVFCFWKKVECIKAMREFYSNKAMVEPQRYYHVIRTLKTLIREKLKFT
uniref:DUF5659 domain-containing protein n=1 Tax=Caldisericum exile TaxID=693075 RepID=A0A7C4YFE1_9BACT